MARPKATKRRTTPVVVPFRLHREGSAPRHRNDPVRSELRASINHELDKMSTETLVSVLPVLVKHNTLTGTVDRPPTDAG